LKVYQFIFKRSWKAWLALFACCIIHTLSLSSSFPIILIIFLTWSLILILFSLEIFKLNYSGPLWFNGVIIELSEKQKENFHYCCAYCNKRFGNNWQQIKYEHKFVFKDKNDALLFKMCV
jgi:hypothetical protein